MKLLAYLAVSALSLPTVCAVSQAAAASSTTLPPFAGRWVMNSKRSKLIRPIRGISSAVILYDGKTWTYIHRHQDDPDEQPEAWQATYVVNSPVLHTSLSGGDITFRSRIQRTGSTMLMTETGTTLHHQQVHTTIRYALQDGGNTLVETETSIGPLGPETNIYVLEREGTGDSGMTTVK